MTRFLWLTVYVGDLVKPVQPFALAVESRGCVFATVGVNSSVE